jgi:polar amino acid transport system substrate-binding protein
MMIMRTSRRIAAAMLPTTLLALTLAACAGGASGTDTASSTTGKSSARGLTDIPAQVITTTADKSLHAQLPQGLGGSIRVAIDLSSPPARLVGPDGKPAGFDVDFSNLLAEKLGGTVKVSNVPFAQLIPGLAAHRYDLSIDNFSRTPQREEQIDMVEYMLGSGGIAVPAANPRHVDASPTSLCGQHLGVLAGSYQELTTVPQIKGACAAKGLKTVASTSYQTNNEAILALGSRRIDAWLGNGSVASYAAHQQPKVFKALIMQGTWSHDNIALPKGSALTPIVAKAFQKLIDEGSYQKVLQKWGIPNYALARTSLVQTPVTQR